MALIKCNECGHDVSDRASACPHCGFPVAVSAIANTAWVKFPVWGHQMYCNNCYIYNSAGEVLAQCKQGEVASFKCEKPMKITVHMQNCFRKPSIEVKPGAKVQAFFRGFGMVFLETVDEFV